jgi:ABC-type phosphate transport system substrate-binding protein
MAMADRRIARGRHRAPRRRPARIAATLLIPVAIGLFGVVASPLELAARADGPQIVLDPAKEITYGQYILVSLSGYAPGAGVAFRQCVAGTESPDLDTQCSPIYPVSTVTDNSGNGTIYLNVLPDPENAATGQGNMVYASSADPDKPCGSSNPCFPCDQNTPCQMAAFTDPHDVGTAVFAKMEYGPSPTACPAPGEHQAFAHGGGSATAYRAMYTWEGIVCQDPKKLSVQTDLTNSYDGVQSWTSGIADFAVTGQPLDADQKAALSAKGKSWAYAPISGSGVVLAYEIFDKRGPQITKLILTPDLIAQQFTSQIPNWNFVDEINQLNPGIQWPSRVVSYYRAEHSAETVAFTTWLTNVASDALGGLDPPWPGPTSVFPGYGFDVGVQGANKLALAIRNPNTDFSTYGNIGFIDASMAAFYGLPTVKIELAPGVDVAATPETILKAITDALPPENDGSVKFKYDDSSQKAWPIPLVSYIPAPTNKIDPAVGAVLRSFITYAVGDGQDALPKFLQYATLPAVLAAEAVAAADQIPHTPHTTTPPPTTTPPHTTTPPPTYYTTSPPYYTTTPPPTFTTSPPSTTSASTAPTVTPCPSPASTTSPTPSASLPPTPPTTTPPTTTPPTTTPPTSSPSSSAFGPPPTPSPTESPCPSSAPAGAIASGGPLAPAPARFILPSIALLGLLGLTAGPALQRLGNRRRAAGTAGIAAAAEAGGPAGAGGPAVPEVPPTP